VQITRTDGGLLIGDHGVTHDLYTEGDWGSIYLLYENGVGGFETVSLRGKWRHKYKTSSTEHLKNRQYGWNVKEGDFGTYANEGRGEIEANTGWLNGPYYLEHLRQLPLAQKVYLIDLTNKLFRAATVAPGDIETNEADTTLFAQQFTIRAGWSDQSANV